MADSNTPSLGGPKLTQLTCASAAALCSTQQAKALQATVKSNLDLLQETIDLQEQVAYLTALVQRIAQEQSVPPDHPIPTSELPLEGSRMSSTSPELHRTKLLERTPKIKPLNDGVFPTFRQWQASIQNCLDINLDYYQSKKARMAAVWGHTTGTAIGYLELQYLADLAASWFSNAKEIIALLHLYFVSSNKQAEYCSAFY
jgi:hypothetical protein